MPSAHIPHKYGVLPTVSKTILNDTIRISWQSKKTNIQLTCKQLTYLTKKPILQLFWYPRLVFLETVLQSVENTAWTVIFERDAWMPWKLQKQENQSDPNPSKRISRDQQLHNQTYEAVYSIHVAKLSRDRLVSMVNAIWWLGKTHDQNIEY